MTARRVLWVLLLLVSATWANYTTVRKEFYAHNARLYASLFKDYIKDLAPTYSLGLKNAPADYEPMPITLQLLFFRVTKIDQVSQSVDVVLALQVTWLDHRLAWDPAEYGGISYILVRSESLWQADIIACEAISKEAVHSDDIAMAKMSNFPFDKHTCRMCFMLDHLTPEEISFQLAPSTNSTVSGKVNNEWALVSLLPEAIVDRDGVAAIFYHCTIMRHPNFWVNLVIIPAYLLGVLVITGLFLGERDGEIEYGLAVMMSITVIIGILAEGLPKSSSLPILGYFVLGQLVIVCVAVFFVVVRREITKFLVFAASRLVKRQVNTRDVLTGLINSPNRSTASRVCRTCLRFLIRVIRSNYIAFVLFQLAHALNLVVILSAFDSEQYAIAIETTAKAAIVAEAFQEKTN